MMNYVLYSLLFVFVLSGCNRSIGIGGDYQYKIRRAPDENCKYLKRPVADGSLDRDDEYYMDVRLANQGIPEDSQYKPEEVKLKEKKHAPQAVVNKNKPQASTVKPVKASAGSPNLSNVPPKKYSKNEAKEIIIKKQSAQKELQKKSQALKPVLKPTAPSISDQIKEMREKEQAANANAQTTSTAVPPVTVVPTEEAPIAPKVVTPELPVAPIMPQNNYPQSMPIPPQQPSVPNLVTPPAAPIAPQPRKPMPNIIPPASPLTSQNKPGISTPNTESRYTIQEKPIPQLPSQ